MSVWSNQSTFFYVHCVPYMTCGNNSFLKAIFPDDGPDFCFTNSCPLNRTGFSHLNCWGVYSSSMGMLIPLLLFIFFSVFKLWILTLGSTLCGVGIFFLISWPDLKYLHNISPGLSAVFLGCLCFNHWCSITSLWGLYWTAVFILRFYTQLNLIMWILRQFMQLYFEESGRSGLNAQARHTFQIFFQRFWELCIFFHPL